MLPYVAFKIAFCITTTFLYARYHAQVTCVWLDFHLWTWGGAGRDDRLRRCFKPAEPEKPNHDLFLTLTTWIFSLNPTRP